MKKKVSYKKHKALANELVAQLVKTYAELTEDWEDEDGDHVAMPILAMSMTDALFGLTVSLRIKPVKCVGCNKTHTVQNPHPGQTTEDFITEQLGTILDGLVELIQISAENYTGHQIKMSAVHGQPSDERADKPLH